MQLQYTPADEAYFWSRVDRNGPIPEHRPDLGPCWVWTGSKLWSGYGTLTFHGRSYRVTRFAYVLAYGSLADDDWVLHHCDYPPCVRPGHLFTGDHAANMADMRKKGRGWRGPRPKMAAERRGTGNPGAKLTDALVIEIRRRVASGERQAHVARDLHISNATLSNVIHRKSWSHIP
jgi:hypothetical protein